jgi:hypothetical protein
VTVPKRAKVCDDVHVLKAESTRDNSTYDRVDWGGERVAKEVVTLQSEKILINLDKSKVMDAVKDLECKGDCVILCYWIQSEWFSRSIFDWVRVNMPHLSTSSQ